MLDNKLIIKGLGTVIQISVISEKNLKDSPLFHKLYRTITDFESTYSRFLDDSQLSLLNQKKEGELSQEFYDILMKSKEIHDMLDGYFNPMVNLGQFGYSRKFEEGIFQKNEQKINSNFSGVNIFGTHISLEEGMSLDIGAIGKGYLADKLYKILLEHGFQDFMVNVGGDIGVHGKNKHGNKWKVGLQSPFDQDMVGVLRLENQFISTSGTYIRFWKTGDENHTHIVDPHKNTTGSDLVSITVVGQHGYKTDALATGLIAMGEQKMLEYCKKFALNCFWVRNDKSIGFSEGFDGKII